MTLDIKESNGTITGLLSGRLDTAASAQFSRDIQPLLDNADKHIVLDCNALEFISSSGLRLFLSLRKQSIAKGGNVTIKGVSPEVKQVFTITGFYSLFSFE
ncbi:MAG: STAS domain-containing protein [Bacteroidaceae bacterium]|nr:STAS domain-containing protein [Bacteroidaceae bacterium]MDO4956826.1 STAS domain-containing protein [Bacteroidales bacterium]